MVNLLVIEVGFYMSAPCTEFAVSIVALYIITIYFATSILVSVCIGYISLINTLYNRNLVFKNTNSIESQSAWLIYICCYLELTSRFSWEVDDGRIYLT